MTFSRVSVPAVSTILAAIAAVQAAGAAPAAGDGLVPVRPDIYAPVTLNADLGSLSAKEREMVGLFVEAAEIMDGLFRQQAYPGDRAALLARIEDPAMRRAVDELSGVLLKRQGDGDYGGVQALTKELGVIRPQLQADLDRLSSRAIPVDVAFTQGKAVLGLD
jgi:hypothetical protein